jgi:hypothetical protein
MNAFIEGHFWLFAGIIVAIWMTMGYYAAVWGYTPDDSATRPCSYCGQIRRDKELSVEAEFVFFAIFWPIALLYKALRGLVRMGVRKAYHRTYSKPEQES